MKKILLLLTLLFSVVAGAMAQNNAIYVYRNDGEFNAFLKSDVDSMRYSHLDADSVYHNDWQMQEVFTADSVYRIPVAAIDSVSFVTPEPEYQKEVMRMDDTWINYVVNIGEDYITFSDSTPSAFLPTKGQVIVAETYEGVLATGFAGRVARLSEEAEGIVCYVDDVELSDIYERLVIVGKAESCSEQEGASPSRIWGNNTGIRFPLPEIEESWEHCSVSFTPNVTLSYIICIGEKNLQDYAKVELKQTYEGELKLNANIETQYTPEPKWAKLFIPINTGVPGLYGRIRFGGFVRAVGSANITGSIGSKMVGVEGFEYKNKQLKPINSWTTEKKTPQVSLSLDGTFSAGLAVQAQFGILAENIVSADVTAYIGPALSGSLSISSNGIVDRSLYSALKESKIDLRLQAEIIPAYTYITLIGKEHEELPYSLNLGYTVNSWYILPEFSDLFWNANRQGGTLVGTPSRTLLMPVQLGWALYDQSNNLYKTYDLNKYRKEDDWDSRGMNLTIEDLPKGKIFKAYPFAKLLGATLCYNKGVDVFGGGCPVSISNVEVVQSSHNEEGYNVGGQNYKYKFDVATTVTVAAQADQNGDKQLDVYDNIADWGYAYENANGKLTHISLKNHKYPYTDTNYAYYRNTASSTLRLYGYVIYINDLEYVYNDPLDFLLEYEEEAPDGMPIITDFKQTDSHYSKNGYTFDGKVYNYKYDVATTVKLNGGIDRNGDGVVNQDDNLDIDDWGYAYEDAEGNVSHVSMMGYNSPFTDTSISHYRNEATSSVRMYGYVLYKGSNEYSYDKAKVFPLEHEKNGNVLLCDSTISYHSDGTISSQTNFTYDEYSNLTSSIHYRSLYYGGRLENSSKYEYTYNANGKRTNELYYDWSSLNRRWNCTKKTEYSYDAAGNLVNEVLYNWKNGQWEIAEEKKYTYDANGNETSCEKNDQLRFETTYDANGNKTIVYYYWQDGRWVISSKGEFTYDANGKLTGIATYDWKDGRWILTYKAKYTIDANGNETDSHYDLEEERWVTDSKTEYTYDANGNATSIIIYHSEYPDFHLALSSKSEYTYDANGNEIEHYCYGYNRSDGQWEFRDHCVYFYSMHFCKDLETLVGAPRPKTSRLMKRTERPMNLKGPQGQVPWPACHNLTEMAL